MERRLAASRWTSLLVLAVAAWGCDQTPSAPEEALAPGGPDSHEVEREILFITGGGRFDYPPGEPGGATNKNTPESRDFQTFGFNVGDRDGDGTPEGQSQYVDHRPSERVNGRPLNIHSVSWSYFARRPEGVCTEGGAIAIGIFEIRNTGEQMEGQLRVCDNGEPGNQTAGDPEDPPDHYYIALANGYEAEGYLTGGNIQAHFDREQGGSGN